MEARASAKYLRGSAQKARLVVDMIRGKRVGEALAILRFTNKRAAGHIEKCLRSAVANATEKAERQNVAVDPDDLFVKTAYVDMGRTKHRRRGRPPPRPPRPAGARLPRAAPLLPRHPAGLHGAGRDPREGEGQEEHEGRRRG